jgi:ABC-type branched-subunit amino acid transport system permease subunit
MPKNLQAPDARGWIMIASFVLVVAVLVMIGTIPTLRSDEFFKTIATLLIGTAWVGGAVSWAFSATKQGGEMADRNQAIVEKQAAASPPISDTKE